MSSEFEDPELGLLYFNFRNYNPLTGTWLSKDKMPVHNLCLYSNAPEQEMDYLGYLRIIRICKSELIENAKNQK